MDSHFPCGSVDWNMDTLSKAPAVSSHFPCGSVDWNHVPVSWCCIPDGHFPCGSVDWNSLIRLKSRLQQVTSLVEVWIEIFCSFSLNVIMPSLPLWKCGLKYCHSCPVYLILTSLPLWKCGLKLRCFLSQIAKRQVTSLVEVWIEISYPVPRQPSCWVTSLVEVWIEISVLHVLEFICRVTSLVEVWIEIDKSATFRLLQPCHFPCGSVDWNYSFYFNYSILFCHFPCGSVDWNIKPVIWRIIRKRHFPCGSVDWNKEAPIVMTSPRVTSLVEVWIEITSCTRRICQSQCHFPCGSVDWNSAK